jgi:hypothetical protein
MKDCLGGDCATPCCVRKMMPLLTETDHPYITSFANDAERALQEDQFPPLEALRVRVDRKIARLEHSQGMDVQEINLVNNCIDPRTGDCRFQDRDPFNGPPLACRIAPLSLSASNPITFPDCPQVLKIAQDPEVIEAILAIRKRMGKDNPEEHPTTSNEAWLRNLATRIAQIEAAQK